MIILSRRLAVAVILSLVAFASVAYAVHSWGGYHWSRPSNPFTLKIGDNVSNVWDGYLTGASSAWSTSSVLDAVVVPGKSKSNCRPTNGRVEVCNKTYGNNGWLGLAQIWVNGSHITQAAVKVNDTYFNTPTYNTSAWRNLVMCQEIGHTFGLDHQDEIFDNANLGTCMDYTNDPSTNQQPNQHDYEELEIIYQHSDVSAPRPNKKSSSSGDDDIDGFNPAKWGKAVKQDDHGHNSLYERGLGNGEKLFTFVIWAY